MVADIPSTSSAANEEPHPPADTSDTTLEKKNRPKDTKLRQQKLAAWQPILTAITVVPAIVVIGLVFLPIGVFLFISSNDVVELTFNYTDCYGTNDKGKNVSCKAYMRGKTQHSDAHTCDCEINFNVSTPFVGDVYFYYGLENYYQNHRRYVKSRSDIQLLGENIIQVVDCLPYRYVNKTVPLIPLVPCGAVANSLFNDTFTIHHLKGGYTKKIPLTAKGVVWPVDLDRKFINPKQKSDEKLKDAFMRAATSSGETAQMVSAGVDFLWFEE